MSTTSRGPQIEVTADESTLRIHLGFWDKVWCCSGDLEIPTSTVDGVAAAALRLVPQEGLRLPGTSWPGAIRAGSYGTGPRRDFWNIRHPEDVLVIQLVPGNHYRRIVLEVPDPRALARRLRPVLGAYAGTFR